MNQAWLTPAKDEPEETTVKFNTNEEALEAFIHDKRNEHSKKYSYGIRNKLLRFLEFLDGRDLSTVTPGQYMNYIGQVEKKCKFYGMSFNRMPRDGVNSRMTWGCSKGLPLNCNSCPAYQAISTTTIGGHVSTIDALYEFLAVSGALPFNPMAAHAKKWWQTNKKAQAKQTAASKNNKELISRREWKKIINSTYEIHWATIMLILVRYGLRASEVVRLRCTPEFLDRDLEWIIIPQSGNDFDKRIDTSPYPIDTEIRRFLRVYLRWRKSKLDRLHGDTDRLFINKDGQPFTQEKGKAAAALNRGLTRWVKRSGIPNPERISSKLGRHEFTNTLESKGLGFMETGILRGDKLEKTSAGNYFDVKRKKEAFLRGSPPLGVLPPGDSPTINHEPARTTPDSRS